MSAASGEKSAETGGKTDSAVKAGDWAMANMDYSNTRAAAYSKIELENDSQPGPRLVV